MGNENRNGSPYHDFAKMADEALTRLKDGYENQHNAMSGKPSTPIVNKPMSAALANPKVQQPTHTPPPTKNIQGGISASAANPMTNEDISKLQSNPIIKVNDIPIPTSTPVSSSAILFKPAHKAELVEYLIKYKYNVIHVDDSLIKIQLGDKIIAIHPLN